MPSGSAVSIERLERIARAQFGVFTTDQAASENVTARLLTYHARAGRRWRRVAPSVYEVVASRHDWRRPLMAALLWGGPDAVLSHSSAAALLDLDGADRRAVQLCLPRSTRPPNGWVAHRRLVPPEGIRTLGPLRHTDPLTALVDLASALDDDRWEWALECALRKRLVALDDVVQAARSVTARRVLARRPLRAPPTGSIRETQFVQLARTVDVDPFERQFPVWRNGKVVAALDLAWPHLGVFIEIDGKWHDGPEAGDYDRHRQNIVVEELGWRPFRFGSDDILRRPRYTARDLEAKFQRARSGIWDERAQAFASPGT
jgi:very-short-patch-repair endonuclease